MSVGAPVLSPRRGARTACQGDSSYGGSGAPTDTGYTALYSTEYAFAAVRRHVTDGSHIDVLLQRSELFICALSLIFRSSPYDSCGHGGQTVFFLFLLHQSTLSAAVASRLWHARIPP